MNTFNETYKNNPKLKDSLLVALMHVFMSKISGAVNPEFPVKAINCFLATKSLSRRTFDLVSANFMGPSLGSPAGGPLTPSNIRGVVPGSLH